MCIFRVILKMDEMIEKKDGNLYIFKCEQTDAVYSPYPMCYSTW